MTPSTSTPGEKPGTSWSTSSRSRAPEARISSRDSRVSTPGLSRTVAGRTDATLVSCFKRASASKRSSSDCPRAATPSSKSAAAPSCANRSRCMRSPFSASDFSRAAEARHRQLFGLSACGRCAASVDGRIGETLRGAEEEPTKIEALAGEVAEGSAHDQDGKRRRLPRETLLEVALPGGADPLLFGNAGDEGERDVEVVGAAVEQNRVVAARVRLYPPRRLDDAGGQRPDGRNGTRPFRDRARPIPAHQSEGEGSGRRRRHGEGTRGTAQPRQRLVSEDEGQRRRDQREPRHRAEVEQDRRAEREIRGRKPGERDEVPSGLKTPQRPDRPPKPEQSEGGGGDETYRERPVHEVLQARPQGTEGVRRHPGEHRVIPVDVA